MASFDFAHCLITMSLSLIFCVPYYPWISDVSFWEMRIGCYGIEAKVGKERG